MIQRFGYFTGLSAFVGSNAKQRNVTFLEDTVFLSVFSSLPAASSMKASTIQFYRQNQSLIQLTIEQENGMGQGILDRRVFEAWIIIRKEIL